MVKMIKISQKCLDLVPWQTCGLWPLSLLWLSQFLASGELSGSFYCTCSEATLMCYQQRVWNTHTHILDQNTATHKTRTVLLPNIEHRLQCKADQDELMLLFSHSLKWWQARHSAETLCNRSTLNSSLTSQVCPTVEQVRTSQMTIFISH